MGINAEDNYAIVLELRNGRLVQKGLEDVATAAGRVEAKAERLTSSWRKLAAVTGLGFIGTRILKETIDAQNAMAQLDAAVRSTGGVAGFTATQLATLAAEMQRVSTFSDEAVMSAQSMLLTFDKIRGETLPAATQAIVDLATRMGGDLRGAALQVGKALQDPEQGLTALRRSGVSFSDAQADVIKRLFETNRVAEAQAIILRELSKEFGGSAAAARNTLGGALTGLKNDFGDLFEVTAGGTSGAIRAINAFSEVIRALQPHMNKIMAAVAGLGAALVAAKALWLAYRGVVLSATAAKLGFSAASAIATGNLLKGAAAVAGGVIGLVVYKKVLAELEKQVRATTDAETAKLAVTEATSDVVDDSVEQAKRLRAENEDMVRVAEQQFKLAGMTKQAAEEEAIRFDAENKMLRAKRERTGELLRETLKAIEAEKDWKIAAMDKTRELEAAVEATEAARDAVNGLTSSIVSDTTGALTQGFRGMLAPFKAIADQMLSTWLTRFVQPAVSSMLGITLPGDAQAPSLSAKAGYLGIAVGAAGLGYGIGSRMPNKTAGALAGAASGAATGAMISGAVSGLDGGISVAVGALVGLTAGILGAANAAKKSAAEMKALQAAFKPAFELYRAEVLGTATELDRAKAAARAQNEEMRKSIETAYAGKANEAERNRLLEENARLLDLHNKKLEEEAAAAKKAAAEAAAIRNREFQEDLRVRRLRLEGHMEEADALALATAQQREYAAAIKEGLDEATLAAMAYVHELEREELRKQQMAEAERRRAAEQETAMRRFEDLHLRYLNALGLGGDAANMAMAHAQQMRDAVREGWSAVELAQLSVVQQLERNQLAAREAAEAQIAVIEKQTAETVARLDAQRAVLGDQLKAAQENERKLVDSVNGLRDLLGSLTNFRQSLNVAELSALSPVEQLSKARGDFEGALAASRSGDVVAGGQIPDLARVFLEQSRSFNASGPAYAADFAMVTTAVDELIAQFGSQLTVEERLLEEAMKHTASLEAQIVQLEKQRDEAENQARRAIDELRSQSYLQQQTIQRVVEELQRNRDAAVAPSDAMLTTLDGLRQTLGGLGSEINNASFQLVQETRNAFVNASNAEIEAIQRGASLQEIAQLRQIRELEQQRMEAARNSSSQINLLAGMYGYDSQQVQEAMRTRDQLDARLREQIAATQGVTSEVRGLRGSPIFIGSNPLTNPITGFPTAADISSPIVGAIGTSNGYLGQIAANTATGVAETRTGMQNIASGLTTLTARIAALEEESRRQRMATDSQTTRVA